MEVMGQIIAALIGLGIIIFWVVFLGLGHESPRAKMPGEVGGILAVRG